MKKIAFLFLLPVMITTNALARKVTLIIHNRSAAKLYYQRDHYTYAGLPAPKYQGINDSYGYFELNGAYQTIQKGTEFQTGVMIKYSTDNSDFGVGVEGSLQFYALDDFSGGQYSFIFSFDNPCIGSNEFSTSLSLPSVNPFRIQYLSGGSGNDATVEYEVTGGPSPIPPSPPIKLPATGNRSITGTIKWNENVCGKPTIDNITKAISIVSTVPALFSRGQGPGLSSKGPNTYQNTNGYYSGTQEAGVVEINLPRFQSTPTQSIGTGQSQNGDFITHIVYRVYNLPDEVPVDLKIELASDWIPGPNAQAKPNRKSAHYFSYLWENRVGEKGIDYEVFGVWMYADEMGKMETLDGHAYAQMSEIKNKPSFHTMDILSRYSRVINKRNIYNETQLGNKNVLENKLNTKTNLQGTIRQTPLQNNSQQKVVLKTKG